MVVEHFNFISILNLFITNLFGGSFDVFGLAVIIVFIALGYLFSLSSTVALGVGVGVSFYMYLLSNQTSYPMLLIFGLCLLGIAVKLFFGLRDIFARS